MMARECGKPLAEARGEFGAAVDQFDWYADEARRIFGHTLGGRDSGVRLDVQYRSGRPRRGLHRLELPGAAAGAQDRRRPRGRLRDHREALRGDAVQRLPVRRGGERSAGLPKGVLGVVTGDPAEISRHLIASPVIRKVSLTGSVAGRKADHEALRRRPEARSASNSAATRPCWSSPTPTRSRRARLARRRSSATTARSASRRRGSMSTRRSRTRSRTRWLESAKALKLGSGVDPSVDLRTDDQRSRPRTGRRRWCRTPIRRGAKVLTGGGRPLAFNRGYFYRADRARQRPGRRPE